MLDVHPPHHAPSGWRDFLIHIGTIAVGLLIAIGFEQTVEFFHHRHLRHQAEENLHAEMRDNRLILARDEAQLQAAIRQFKKNLAILAALRAHTTPPGELAFNWYWSSMQSAGLNTARDTGALALMPYDAAQEFSVVYGQQDIVNRQALAYIDDIYRISAPLEGRKAADLQPAELDAMTALTQQTLSDIEHLHDLCTNLDAIYARTAGQL